LELLKTRELLLYIGLQTMTRTGPPWESTWVQLRLKKLYSVPP
jgi:hypothetical protein